jgi:2-keto-4-pentenoate hydratase/2-oxohepta-3-ene-1,7-dioic acid hydratase in catechol pathway
VQCPDTFCPVGPHIVTADEVPDPNSNPLEISTRVNGVYKQRTTTDTIIHSIPTLLEFLTQTVTLQPGHPMSSDTVTVGVTGVGYLSNPLEAGWE